MTQIKPPAPPKLRVVAPHSLHGTPRHRIAWSLGNYPLETLCVLECWSEAEWQAMHAAERPAHAVRLPGFGYVALAAVPEAEWHEAARESAARHYYGKGR